MDNEGINDTLKDRPQRKRKTLNRLKQNKKVKVSIHLDEDLYKFIERQASEKGIPLSLTTNILLRKACSGYLQKKNSKAMF